MNGGGTGRGQRPVGLGVGAMLGCTGWEQRPEVGAIWGAGLEQEPDEDGITSATARILVAVGSVVSETNGGIMKLSTFPINSSSSSSDSEL